MRLTVVIVIAGFVSCSDDDSVPANSSDPVYVYSGFILNISGQDVIRVQDGKADRKVFIYSDEIRPTIVFSFLDQDGKVVSTPPDSVVVLFDLGDSDRFSIYPNSLPDPTFQWSFSIDAMRLGVTELHVSFFPEGTCAPGDVTVQAVG